MYRQETGTTAHPLVSVIVVNFNKRDYLEKCFSSIAAQAYEPLEAILVDNGSTDDSAAFVKEAFPWVRVFALRENVGFARGNNVGITLAKGSLIATLNNDTEVMPGWVSEMVRAITSDARVGMCASKMLFMSSPGVINSTGIVVSRSGACWDRGMSEPDLGQYEEEGEVFGPCAGAAMYKREMLEEVGLFDEDFLAYMEDTDLAFRGQLAGWKCLYVPKAVVYHLGSGTAGYMTDFSIYHGNRNAVWNFVKNYRGLTFFRCLPWALGRNLAVIPFYATKGFAATIVRAKVDAIKGLPGMLAKRRQKLPSGQGVEKFINTWASVPLPTDAAGNKSRPRAVKRPY